jgi:flavin reductase (DIM6/NTAB) family NADH-FMN oxidoreductase RutF/rubredoxin
MSIDGKALWSISYGMYIVSARAGGKANGQIANAVFQVTAEPPRLAVAINKENLTNRLIRESGAFGVSVLAEDVPMELIGRFGFKSGRDIDKLAGIPFRDGALAPLVTDHAISITEARVISEVDTGTHTLFVGEVIAAEMLASTPPLTYAGYHARKGRAPKNAPTYQPEDTQAQAPTPVAAARRYVCGVCGHVYDPTFGDPGQGVAPGTLFENLPADWVCPVCGASRDEFSPE